MSRPIGEESDNKNHTGIKEYSLHVTRGELARPTAKMPPENWASGTSTFLLPVCPRMKLCPQGWSATRSQITSGKRIWVFCGFLKCPVPQFGPLGSKDICGETKHWLLSLEGESVVPRVHQVDSWSLAAAAGPARCNVPRMVPAMQWTRMGWR